MGKQSVRYGWYNSKIWIRNGWDMVKLWVRYGYVIGGIG